MSDIDNKFQQFSTIILDKVTQLIDDKLSNIGDHFQSIATIPKRLNEDYKTFKDVLSQNLPATNNKQNFNEIINDNRNEQLVQESERKIALLMS